MKRIDTILWFPRNAEQFILTGHNTRTEAKAACYGEVDSDNNPFTHAAKVRLIEIPRKKRRKA